MASHTVTINTLGQIKTMMIVLKLNQFLLFVVIKLAFSLYAFMSVQQQTLCRTQRQT